VTGWRVPNVLWKGVRLADVLDRAGVHADARALHFRSFDGAYAESLTLEQARRDDVIVAYEFEGAPLSDEHGGPVPPVCRADVRLQVDQVAGHGSSSPRRSSGGFWEQRGYDVDGWVGRSNGRDDQPT